MGLSERVPARISFLSLSLSLAFPFLSLSPKLTHLFLFDLPFPLSIHDKFSLPYSTHASFAQTVLDECGASARSCPLAVEWLADVKEEAGDKVTAKEVSKLATLFLGSRDCEESGEGGSRSRT